MFETGKGKVVVEQEDFKEGILDGDIHVEELDKTFVSETKEALLEEVAEYFIIDVADIEVEEENGVDRVEFDRLENEEGYAASQQEIEGWREGKVDLYCAWYGFDLYKKF